MPFSQALPQDTRPRRPSRARLTQTRDARVVLTGRATLDAARQAIIDRLDPPSTQQSAQTERVLYRQVDLTDGDQVRRLVSALDDELGPLTGVLHCAGMVTDEVIVKKTGAQFAEVLAPKVLGTYHLD